MSESLRMMNTALRERVATALYNDYCRELGENREPFAAILDEDRTYYCEQADAVLAALGLDDLDAAVERMLFSASFYSSPTSSISKHEAERLLEAALFATEGGDDA